MRYLKYNEDLERAIREVYAIRPDCSLILFEQRISNYTLKMLIIIIIYVLNRKMKEATARASICLFNLGVPDNC